MFFAAWQVKVTLLRNIEIHFYRLMCLSQVKRFPQKCEPLK